MVSLKVFVNDAWFYQRVPFRNFTDKPLPYLSGFASSSVEPLVKHSPHSFVVAAHRAKVERYPVVALVSLQLLIKLVDALF